MSAFIVIGQLLYVAPVRAYEYCTGIVGTFMCHNLVAHCSTSACDFCAISPCLLKVYIRVYVTVEKNCWLVENGAYIAEAQEFKKKKKKKKQQPDVSHVTECVNELN